MEQGFDKLLMFRNRLIKVYRHLSRQARQMNIGCYRIYDHDIPEFPFILEVYEDKLYVAEYKRRHNLSDEEHGNWMLQCKKIMSEVLNIKDENIFLKIRQKKAGRQGQYQKMGETADEYIVNENGLKFIVNLATYLDTGLFLDHRVTRQMVKELAAGKKVLNLFSYTGSFSVYALAGNCGHVVSVDLSKTYMNWAARNIILNFPEFPAHSETHADVKKYLTSMPDASFDFIIMDPPTFSNSKRMTDFLDIQKDHVSMVNQCMRLLSAEGSLIFSTNYTRFSLDASNINAREIKDITRATTPFDFAGKLKRQCFHIFN